MNNWFNKKKRDLKKMPHNSLFSWGLSHFSWIIAFWIVASLWLILQFWKSLVFRGELCHRILVPQPEMESIPSALKSWSPNHWTAREFSQNWLLTIFFCQCSYWFYRVDFWRSLLNHCWSALLLAPFHCDFPHRSKSSLLIHLFNRYEIPQIIYFFFFWISTVYY